MQLKRRSILPLVQTGIAVAMTVSVFSKPESETYVYSEDFGLQLGFALNGPATTLRYILERFAVQFCPASYGGYVGTGCYPLAPIFETVIYFMLVWLLWYAVVIEAGARGQSALTSRTGRRGLTVSV